MSSFRARRADTKLVLLRQYPPLAACSKRELLRVARAGDLATISPHRDLIAIGDAPRWVYLVLSGDTVCIDRRGHTHAGTGALLGDLEAVASCPSAYTVRALSTVEAVVFRTPDFVELLDEVPALRIGLRASIRAMALRTFPTPTRYARIPAHGYR